MAVEVTGWLSHTSHNAPFHPLSVYPLLSFPDTPVHVSTCHAISPRSGNPGLLDFYVPFLDTIYSEANSSDSSSITIFAHAHLGLSFIGGDRSFPDSSSVDLAAQVQAHLEFFDDLLATYGPETSVLLVGHSIGAWFIQEMLKSRAAALHLRPRMGAFMLFPVISDIATSSAGKRFSVRTSTAAVSGIQYI